MTCYFFRHYGRRRVDEVAVVTRGAKIESCSAVFENTDGALIAQLGETGKAVTRVGLLRHVPQPAHSILRQWGHPDAGHHMVEKLADHGVARVFQIRAMPERPLGLLTAFRSEYIGCAAFNPCNS